MSYAPVNQREFTLTVKRGIDNKYRAAVTVGNEVLSSTREDLREALSNLADQIYGALRG